MSTTTPKRLTLSLIINLLFHCQMKHIPLGHMGHFSCTLAIFLSSFSCSSIHLFILSLFILKYILLFQNTDENIEIPFFMHGQWPLFTIHRNRTASKHINVKTTSQRHVEMMYWSWNAIIHREKSSTIGQFAYFNFVTNLLFFDWNVARKWSPDSFRIRWKISRAQNSEKKRENNRKKEWKKK